jgi:hypothetical protein
MDKEKVLISVSLLSLSLSLTHTHTHTQILFVLKEEKPTICDNMEEPGRHYAK